MRDLADANLVRRFMCELGRAAHKTASIYFTGGASAVLLGWRQSTVDLDIKLVADDESTLREIPRLKEELHVNVELAAPDQFIPPLPGWQERSQFIATEGVLSFYHYDFYSQTLAKIERGHHIDLEDARAMRDRGWIEPVRLRELFERIKSELYRYPAIDPKSYEAALERFLGA